MRKRLRLWFLVAMLTGCTGLAWYYRANPEAGNAKSAEHADHVTSCPECGSTDTNWMVKSTYICKECGHIFNGLAK